MASSGRGGGDPFGNVEPLFPRGRQPDFRNFRVGRGTRRILYVAGAILLLIFVVGPLVGFYTDLLWFRSLDYEQLFLTRFRYEGVIFLVTFVLAFIPLATSTGYAVRQVGFSGLTAIGVSRRFLTAAAGRLVVAAAAVVALVMASIASGSWETVAKGLNGASFGRTDPVFGQDIGFYVFQLPLYRYAWGWLLALLVVCAGAALAVYLPRGGTAGLGRRALSHLAIFSAAFFILLAVHYRLAMFELLLSKNGFVFGAGNADVNVRLPLNWVMLALSLLFAGLSLLCVVRPRPGLLVGPPAAWLFVAVVLLAIVPAIYQRFVVVPSELSQEKPYIQREIDGTNTAFGLDKATFTDFPDKQQVTSDLLAANAPTISNVRLWDYTPLKDAYNQIQNIRQFYDFTDVDIDRYNLSTGYRQVMLSARELNTDLLPTTNWVNLHLKYTHGYGAAATRVAQVGLEGRPDLILSDIPPAGEPAITRPQIYFGETNSSGYVVVDTREPEVDYEKGDATAYSNWTGTHGVQLTGGLRRLAYAYQLGDLNLLLSSQITSSSQLLYRRSINDRLSTLTPFLTFDNDPYLVIDQGRMYWIEDAYTTSNAYPYSSPLQDGGPNYIRNSVKVVVDAYDGTVKYYIADPSDPVIRTYEGIFPGAFTPIDQMPAGLRQHIRYPVDLFTIQQQVLQNYHMHDPQQFFGRSDAWAQPNEITQQGGSPQPIQPYYVVMKLPGQDHEEFVLIEPFSPLNKRNMVAWMAARSDGTSYGQLQVFRFPTDRQVTGPEQVESRIDQDPTISSQLSLLNQNGSKVLRGNLLVIPIADSILFVKPIYLESVNQPIPELRKVVVADEQRVVWADTLDQALQLLTSGQAAPTSTPTPTGTPPATQTLQQLTTRAQQLYADAQAKLKAGDFAGYAQDIQQLGPVLDQIRAETGAPAPSPSPSSGARGSPSPSP